MKTGHFLRTALCAAVISSGLLMSGGAFAEMYDYGGYAISAHDRDVLRGFIVNEHARSCHENETRRIEPCGLASQMLVSYAPATVLPLDVHDEVIPEHISHEIAKPPQGSAYVYANGNVYLIDVLSRNIIDSVPLGSD